MNDHQEQKIIMIGKEKLDMVGVTKVEDFDKNSIYLETILGDFVIKGKDLHIAQLLLEEEKLSVIGEIVSLEFVDGLHKKNEHKKGGGLFKRITR